MFYLVMILILKQITPEET